MATMNKTVIRKRFNIVLADAGTEAYTDEYVEMLERQNRELRKGLLSIRACIDHSQPMDTIGAVMAIDHLLKA